MSLGSLWTPVLESHQASIAEFIACWSRLYHDPLESIYTDNIGRPLSPKRIDALFKWKNGGKISSKKAQSIRSNYYGAPKRLNAVSDPEHFESLWKAIGGGGVVWGVFLLHIWKPIRFPIFDQHVYRAMRLMTGADPEELSELRDSVKVSRYTEDYLPFWNKLSQDRGGRVVDKALWAFGKAMKNPSGSDLNWFAAMSK